MVRFATVLLLLAVRSQATVVEKINFEDLVSRSEQIVVGRVQRQWVSWGPEKRFIWTRTEVSVESVLKGQPARTITVSEPGGELDGQRMVVAGAVSYATGERVTLFLHRMPTNDLRTVGWTQGKFLIADDGRIHPAQTADLSLLAKKTSGTDISKLDGATVSELRSRVHSLAPKGSGR